ncbi:MAG: hypothetical protein ACLQVI_00995 [Polyangiaceae bacterium]
MKLTHLVARCRLVSLVSFVSLASVACGGSPPAAQNEGTDAGSASTPASSTHPGPTGSVCTAITETYNVCADLSTCPGVIIDPNTFPQCGYAVHGDVIDPECLCYGSMCPMGVPQTCADMQAILSSGTTVDIICEQQATGKCLNVGGGTPAPTTCQVCQNNCGNDPACLQNCGC